MKPSSYNDFFLHKSLPVAAPNELVLVLGKMNLRTKFDKNRTKNAIAIVDTS